MLFRSQTQLRLGVGAHGAIHMKPCVENSHFHKPIDPGFGQQMIDVGLGKAGANSRHHIVLQAVLDAGQSLTVNSGPTTSLVTDDFIAFHADEWCDVAQFEQSSSFLVGDELTVRKDLEVAVRMAFQNLKEFRVHERFAAHDSEERIAVLLRFIDQSVHRRNINGLLLVSHVDPASLATQVTAVDDGDVQKRRKELPFLHPAAMLHHGQRPFNAHVPDKLPQQSLVRFEQHAFCHAQGIHVGSRLKNVRRIWFRCERGPFKSGFLCARLL